MKDLTPEFEWLLAGAPYPLQPEEGARLSRCCRGVQDWEAALALARRHNVASTVYLNLERHARSDVPANVLERLKGVQERSRRRALALTAEFLRVRQACDSAGLPIWLLKGPLLSQELFGDVGLRLTGDLDLLAPPDEIAPVERVVLSLGYQRSQPVRPLGPRQWRAFIILNHHSTYIQPDKGVRLELHWSLANAYLVPPGAVRAMQARASALTQAGGQVAALTLEDTLACLLLHGAKHNWARLKWVVDIDAVVRNRRAVDWTRLARTMTDLQLQRPLAQGFGLAREVFATPIPEAVQRIVDAEPLAPALVAGAWRALLADEDYLKTAGPFVQFKQAWYVARLKPGLAYRFSYLAAFLLHSLNDWNDYPLPDSLFPLYYLMRPFTWAWRYFVRRAHPVSHP